MPPIEDWLTFKLTEQFEADWDALGLTDRDLARLEAEILNDPDCGDVVAGSGGMRKVRFAEEGEGKSGAYRVCYANFLAEGVVYLLLVFGKREKANLSRADLAAVRKFIGVLGKTLRGE